MGHTLHGSIRELMQLDLSTMRAAQATYAQGVAIMRQHISQMPRTPDNRPKWPWWLAHMTGLARRNQADLMLQCIGRGFVWLEKDPPPLVREAMATIADGIARFGAWYPYRHAVDLYPLDCGILRNCKITVDMLREIPSRLHGHFHPLRTSGDSVEALSAQAMMPLSNTILPAEWKRTAMGVHESHASALSSYDQMTVETLGVLLASLKQHQISLVAMADLASACETRQRHMKNTVLGTAAMMQNQDGIVTGYVTSMLPVVTQSPLMARVIVFCLASRLRDDDVWGPRCRALLERMLQTHRTVPLPPAPAQLSANGSMVLLNLLGAPNELRRQVGRRATKKNTTTVEGETTTTTATTATTKRTREPDTDDEAEDHCMEAMRHDALKTQRTCYLLQARDITDALHGKVMDVASGKKVITSTITNLPSVDAAACISIRSASIVDAE